MQHTALAIDEFGQRLSDYEQWKTKLTAAIESYQEWYDSQQEGDTDEELKLYELIEELRNDTLTIALVGEFSRGKTELINALSSKIAPLDAWPHNYVHHWDSIRWENRPLYPSTPDREP